jgi:DNA-binding response OmpR family regulator
MKNGKKRILVIEDDAEMRSLLKDFFEEEGFEIDSVSNGFEALQILIRGFFDLIITDIRMPGLTGLDILPRLRKFQPRASIIVITAFGSEEVHRRAMERGASVYLEKPLRFHELKTIIHEIASSKEKKKGDEKWSES